MSELDITVVVIGGLLLGIFVFFITVTVNEGRREPELSQPRAIAGILTFLFGLVNLSFWFYYAIRGWSRMKVQFSGLWPHIFLELASSIALIIAGVALLRE